MARALVSLLSEQVIAATLFCRKVGKSGDDLFIITTEKMKSDGKLDDLIGSLKASGLQLNLHEVLLETEENLAKVREKLEAEHWNGYSEIFVDITLGTKIMSIGVYSFFEAFRNTYTTSAICLYYQPRGHNQLVNLCTHESEDLGTVSLENYLCAYGIRLNRKQSNLINKPEITKLVFAEFANKWSRTSQLFQKLRNARRPELRGQKIISIESESLNRVVLKNGDPWHPNDDDIKTMQAMCNAVGFDSNALMNKHIAYLSGGWFEEWLYAIIKEALPELRDDQIRLSLEIATKANVSNELDIALIGLRNSFVCIECKTSFNAGEEHGDILVDTIYKQAALRKNFGLSAISILATLDEVKRVPAKERARDFGIRLFDISILKDEECLQQELRKLLSK